MRDFKQTANPVLDEMVLGAMKPVVAFAWAKGGADGLEGALRRLNDTGDAVKHTGVDE